MVTYSSGSIFPDGVLFFPVTPFTEAGAVNVELLAEHLKRGLAAGPAAVFAACGTGEFHALGPGEYREVVRVAVEVAGNQVPVFTGTGGALPLARDFASIAEEEGADGLLLLPPYLVAAPPAGLVAYTRAVTEATGLPLIAYQRGNAVFDPASAAAVAKLPGVLGFKDGLGNMELMSKIIVAVREALDGQAKPFRFFNGMPTAEVSVAAYRGLGVDLYSSAVFCFAPEISLAFYDADQDLTERLLRDFFHPLISLRDRVPGYAVSLVKAGVRLRGLDVGSVRPPLVDPPPEHLAELERIIDAGLAVVQ
jgi:5-dehydro-4-deoxyglucarate dehydratase